MKKKAYNPSLLSLVAKPLLFGIPAAGALLTLKAIEKQELKSRQEDALRAALQLFPELRKYDPKLIALHAKSFATLNPELAGDPMLLASFLRTTLALKHVEPTLAKQVAMPRRDITEELLMRFIDT